MESQARRVKENSPLKVVGSNTAKFRKLEKESKKIYINSLLPNFSYLNNLGAVVRTDNCVLL